MRSLQSRAASYHSEIQSLTIKHAQLQSTHTASLNKLDSLHQQTSQYSRTVQQLEQTIQQLRADKQSLKQSHSQYRADVYQQIEQLKRDFIATQQNYEATLRHYKQGGEGRQQELERMKRKLAEYKRQMNNEDERAVLAKSEGAEAEFATVTKKADEEEKQPSTSDEGDGVIDFSAEVEIHRVHGVSVDSRIKQLTLGKERVVRSQGSSDNERFVRSHSTNSCGDCEQEI